MQKANFNQAGYFSKFSVLQRGVYSLYLVSFRKGYDFSLVFCIDFPFSDESYSYDNTFLF